MPFNNDQDEVEFIRRVDEEELSFLCVVVVATTRSRYRACKRDVVQLTTTMKKKNGMSPLSFPFLQAYSQVTVFIALKRKSTQIAI